LLAANRSKRQTCVVVASKSDAPMQSLT